WNAALRRRLPPVDGKTHRAMSIDNIRAEGIDNTRDALTNDRIPASQKLMNKPDRRWVFWPLWSPKKIAVSNAMHQNAIAMMCWLGFAAESHNANLVAAFDLRFAKRGGEAFGASFHHRRIKNATVKYAHVTLALVRDSKHLVPVV